ncbi:MAG TPA: rRNA maturation RNase YbeY [Terriglobales bacterium]|nr:rRNA maturation RNase YbeY [Terriglobales bacterium]
MSMRTLARFLARARNAAGLRGDVNVLVTSSRQLRQLNRRYRGKDKATDVLSFPAGSHENGFAGDIAIAAEIAAQNARRYGHKPADELKILTLHGILHLAGYDHERDNGRMARREAQLRVKLGLPASLTERSAAARSSHRKPGPRTSAKRSTRPSRSKAGAR